MDTTTTDRVLRGLAVHRACGAPALACLAELTRREGPGTTLAPAPDAPGATSGTDLATVVDLAAGAELRALLGGDQRLATSVLALHLAGPLPPLAQLAVRAEGVVVRGRRTVVGVTVLGAGEPVGRGTAAFTVVGDGLTPIPWELGGGVTVVVELGAHELTDDERAVLGLGRRDSWADQLLVAAVGTGADGLQLVPTSLMVNRAGGVQGGVLAGFAVRAAGEGELASLQLDFLSAAVVERPVVAGVRVLRETRRSRTVLVELEQAGELVATASVGLRRTGQ